MGLQQLLDCQTLKTLVLISLTWQITTDSCTPASLSMMFLKTTAPLTNSPWWLFTASLACNPWSGWLAIGAGTMGAVVLALYPGGD